jgi:hypothetical protein
MLPTNFDSLTDERPDLAATLRQVARWIREHPDWEILDPRELARTAKQIDPWTLASALHLLVERGFFRQVYMVTTPSGVLADGEFDDPRKIPERLPDRFNRHFETAESDIVAVLTAPR